MIIPCLNEAEALPGVLARIPAGYQALVVDNGSDDDTAAVAAAHGARVVREPKRGYGAAVAAGLDAAETEVVAFLDGDGSMAPEELPPLVAELSNADLVVGRRRPVSKAGWPLHARIANIVLAYRLRRRFGLPVHDIGPVRVVRREALLQLGPLHPRFGYPLELLCRAAESGWTVVERDITYAPRAGGKSKVSGSLTGTVRTVRDFWAVRG
ncbi:glycosyltransferase family 2 protein [Skermania sp. ID1734]|nr:glycosyltransferase family 2 protein [Skermania sp. ID1734]